MEHEMLDFTADKNPEALKEFIKREGIACIDMKFCDMAGFWRHMTLPIDGLCDDMWTKGVGVDGSSIPQFAGVNKADIGIVPDLRSGFIDEAFDRPCLSFICDVVRPGNLAPHPADPRGVAKRAEGYLCKSGAADEIRFMAELEYYVFNRAEYHVGEDEAYWAITSSEGNPVNSGADSCDCCGEGSSAILKIPPGYGYLITPPLDAYTNMRDEIVEKLTSLGIGVKYHHHEGGAYGQQEIELKFAGLLDSSDHILLTKYIARLVAAEWGANITFMPKPLPNKPGTGMHYHMQLRKGGKTVSCSKDGYAGLSPTALSFIGGILSHGRALMAITSASTNSYRRLKPGHETPTSFYFAAANREAAIRIPIYTRDPDEKRWEYRPSDATGNPYLSLAAIVMAGLDGIERNIDPTKEGFGPYDGPGPNIKRSPKTLKKLLPTSLEEALLALDADHDFLLKGDVFSEDLIKTYIEFKYEKDIRLLQNHPHPYEFELYFNL